MASTGPAAGSFQGFGERVRTFSDHSRQSSGGAASSLSATSAAARRSHSPLPQNPSSLSVPYSPHSYGQQTDLSSLGSSQSDLESHRKLSMSHSIRSNSPSLAPPPSQQPSATSPSAALFASSPSAAAFASASTSFSGGASGRPAFGRQSYSDGPPPVHGLQMEENVTASSALSASASRNASFSGSVPSFIHPGSVPSDNVNVQGQSANSSLPQPPPSSGPLSASDPRTQLLVSNLPYRVRWQDLKDLFRKAGTVLRADVSLSADNRSRGYGTVLMATEQDAVKAADMLGGFTWQGRTLDVRIDRSGTLVGVAGSAVTPNLNTGSGTGTASPISVPGTAGFSSPIGSSSANMTNPSSSGFLGVPGVGVAGSQSHSPASFGGTSPLLGSSPSALSPLAQAAQSQSLHGRGSFSGPLDTVPPSTAGSQGGLSDFERGFLHGQMLGGGSSGGAAHSTSAATHQQHRLQTPSQQQQQQQQQQQHSHQQHQFSHHNPTLQPFLSKQQASSARRGSDVNALPLPSQLGSGGWSQANSGGGDATSGLYAQNNTGGSSVPTGFPGATAMAPWPAGPGSFPGAGPGSMQSQPFNAHVVPNGMPTTSYAGRVLFVGNLPFHCQWQDLKDLFRAAGNIQRADVAIGPDGRSRGFGTVLFATQEDAQNAVRLYHGYEYSGRTLKVHFDRFAAQNGPAVGTPGNPAQYTGAFAAAALPSHMTNNIRPPNFPLQNAGAGSLGGAGSPFAKPAEPAGLFQQQQQQQAFGQGAHQAHQQPQQRYQHQHQQFGLGGMGSAMQPHSFSALGSNPGITSAQQQYHQRGSRLAPGAVDSIGDRYGKRDQSFGLYASSGSVAQAQEGQGDMPHERESSMTITLPANGGFGAAASYLPSDLMSPGLGSPPPPPASSSLLSHASSASAHPGRIQLPPLGLANSSVIAGAGGGHMSPASARAHVPMTPGMPGFSFHQIPETPPLYPHFLSPGLGPFSPPLGGSAGQQQSDSAVDAASGGVNSSGAFAGFMNAAPGAPIGYNPMFPLGGATYGSQAGQAGAVGYGQQQPPTPHWSQPSGPRRGLGTTHRAASDALHGAVGAVGFGQGDSSNDSDLDRHDIAKTPGAGPRARPPPLEEMMGNADEGQDSSALGRRASDVTPGAATPPNNDGYPFPLVAAPGVASHLTRRASTNSPAASPMAGPRTGADAHSAGERGPDGRSEHANAAAVAGEALSATSTEELAKTIARLSVKGAALAKDTSSKRSLSMTAERSAAATAMARLREQAGTPTASSPLASQQQQQQHEGNADFADDAADASKLASSGLGAPFGESEAAQAGAGRAAVVEPIEKLLGVRVPNNVLEAARNSSALDTGSDAGGSRKSTPGEEIGPVA
ncbi:hypothetical protein BCV70DRAFT_61530 [Testicularia cyperi]|uniref:RRM domain-containing protein n=1 Tax=Testicularia cyperi TaxID=1882483 RepID=A0A317XVK3_9BASI|nr:hypothetical protein BCV70DRAFT_61530 [Testicularia cyperi]